MSPLTFDWQVAVPTAIFLNRYSIKIMGGFAQRKRDCLLAAAESFHQVMAHGQFTLFLAFASFQGSSTNMDWKALPLVGSPQPKRSWQELPVTVASGPATAGNTDFSRTIVGPPVKQVKREGLLRDWQSIPLANTSNGLAQSDPANKSQQRKVSIGGSHWQELALSSTAGNKVSSKYQENGMDERRILEVLAEGCKCKNNCLSAFKASEVIAWCKAFHLADYTKLRMCLFSLYHPEATEWSQEASLTISGRSSRTQLEICGSHICVESFCRLLGMSRKRFYKLVNGEPDLRTKESGTRPTFCPKQAQVDEFFRDLYQSAAEPLAVGLHFSDELIVAWLHLLCLQFTMFAFFLFGLPGCAREPWRFGSRSRHHRDTQGLVCPFITSRICHPKLWQLCACSEKISATWNPHRSVLAVLGLA